ncbi:MAG TPA: hypothetical protein VF070_49430 [Streptosporangiaceae bacterium]
MTNIVPVDGMPERRSWARPTTSATIRRRSVTVLLFALLAAGLFTLYLRVSRTYPENSDEANILLMAWDMMHGHVMLHGWAMSDVSFYTTELPQYALLESFLGLAPDTAHVGAAMTYTLVVLLAAILARGKKSQVPSGEGAIRMLLAAGILIAPELGTGVFILLLSVGHIGTAVPLMLTWLVIDRGRRRWPEAVAVGLLLAWALIADPLVLVVGILPLVAVCMLRVFRTFPAVAREVGRSALRRAVARASGYELALAVAAGAAYGLALITEGLLHYNGGYRVHSVGYQLSSPAQWPQHMWVTIQGWLAMFGGWPWGSAADNFFAVMHMAGVGLVAWAMWRVARRFFRYPGLVDQVLLTGIVFNVVLYVPSALASGSALNAREYAIALPYGAVLAGRTLGQSLRFSLPVWATWAYGPLRAGRVRLAIPALAAVSGCYLASLGYSAAQPAAPPANHQLTAWLAAHNLTYGISGYWQSSIVTVDSEGKIAIRAVDPWDLRRDWWESKRSWYYPGTHTATFLVTQSQPGFFNYWQPFSSPTSTFGQPFTTYQVGSYTVYVWSRNLLSSG